MEHEIMERTDKMLRSDDSAYAVADKELARSVGCDVTQLQQFSGASLHFLASVLKSGDIGSGYAQCGIDRIAQKVISGECSAERVQCRQQVELRATAVPGGDAVTTFIKPVGPSILREMLCVRSTTDDTGVLAAFFVEQMEAMGAQGIVGRQEANQTPGDQPPVGWPITAHLASFRNFVVPTGIFFEPDNELSVRIRNQSGVAASYVIMLTYDLIRAG